MLVVTAVIIILSKDVRHNTCVSRLEFVPYLIVDIA